MRSGIGRSFLLALLALALAACGSSPKTAFYALKPTGDEAQVTRTSSLRAPVTVSEVRIPPILDRTQMVRRADGPRVVVDSEHRWAGPLEEMIRNTLAENLRRRLPKGAVMMSAPSPLPDTLRQVTVEIGRFDPDEDGTVVLDAGWSLYDKPDGPPVLHRDEHIRQPGAPDPDGEATAMSKALGLLADRIAANF
jgi:uncharacterized lipoprotein YmbA